MLGPSPPVQRHVAVRGLGHGLAQHGEGALELGQLEQREAAVGQQTRAHRVGRGQQRRRPPEQVGRRGVVEALEGAAAAAGQQHGGAPG